MTLKFPRRSRGNRHRPRAERREYNAKRTGPKHPDDPSPRHKQQRLDGSGGQVSTNPLPLYNQPALGNLPPIITPATSGQMLLPPPPPPIYGEPIPNYSGGYINPFGQFSGQQPQFYNPQQPSYGPTYYGTAAGYAQQYHGQFPNQAPSGPYANLTWNQNTLGPLEHAPRFNTREGYFNPYYTSRDLESRTDIDAPTEASEYDPDPQRSPSVKASAPEQHPPYHDFLDKQPLPKDKSYDTNIGSVLDPTKSSDIAGQITTSETMKPDPSDKKSSLSKPSELFKVTTLSDVSGVPPNTVNPASIYNVKEQKFDPPDNSPTKRSTKKPEQIADEELLRNLRLAGHKSHSSPIRSRQHEVSNSPIRPPQHEVGNSPIRPPQHGASRPISISSSFVNIFPGQTSTSRYKYLIENCIDISNDNSAHLNDRCFAFLITTVVAHFKGKYPGSPIEEIEHYNTKDRSRQPNLLHSRYSTSIGNFFSLVGSQWVSSFVVDHAVNLLSKPKPGYVFVATSFLHNTGLMIDKPSFMTETEFIEYFRKHALAKRSLYTHGDGSPSQHGPIIKAVVVFYTKNHFSLVDIDFQHRTLSVYDSLFDQGKQDYVMSVMRFVGLFFAHYFGHSTVDDFQVKYQVYRPQYNTYDCAIPVIDDAIALLAGKESTTVNAEHLHPADKSLPQDQQFSAQTQNWAQDYRRGLLYTLILDDIPELQSILGRSKDFKFQPRQLYELNDKTIGLHRKRTLHQAYVSSVRTSINLDEVVKVVQTEQDDRRTSLVVSPSANKQVVAGKSRSTNEGSPMKVTRFLEPTSRPASLALMELDTVLQVVNESVTQSPLPEFIYGYRELMYSVMTSPRIAGLTTSDITSLVRQKLLVLGKDIPTTLHSPVEAILSNDGNLTFISLTDNKWSLAVLPGRTLSTNEFKELINLPTRPFKPWELLVRNDSPIYVVMMHRYSGGMSGVQEAKGRQREQLTEFQYVYRLFWPRGGEFPRKQSRNQAEPKRDLWTHIAVTKKGTSTLLKLITPEVLTQLGALNEEYAHVDINSDARPQAWFFTYGLHGSSCNNTSWAEMREEFPHVNIILFQNIERTNTHPQTQGHLDCDKLYSGYQLLCHHTADVVGPHLFWNCFRVDLLAQLHPSSNISPSILSAKSSISTIKHVYNEIVNHRKFLESNKSLYYMRRDRAFNFGNFIKDCPKLQYQTLLSSTIGTNISSYSSAGRNSITNGLCIEKSIQLPNLIHRYCTWCTELISGNCYHSDRLTTRMVACTDVLSVTTCDNQACLDKEVAFASVLDAERWKSATQTMAYRPFTSDELRAKLLQLISITPTSFLSDKDVTDLSDPSKLIPQTPTDTSRRRRLTVIVSPINEPQVLVENRPISSMTLYDQAESRPSSATRSTNPICCLLDMPNTGLTIAQRIIINQFCHSDDGSFKDVALATVRQNISIRVLPSKRELDKCIEKHILWHKQVHKWERKLRSTPNFENMSRTAFLSLVQDEEPEIYFAAALLATLASGKSFIRDWALQSYKLVDDRGYKYVEPGSDSGSSDKQRSRALQGLKDKFTNMVGDGLSRLSKKRFADEEVKQLLELRAKRVDWLAISEKMNRKEESLITKWKDMGGATNGYLIQDLSENVKKQKLYNEFLLRHYRQTSGSRRDSRRMEEDDDQDHEDLDDEDLYRY